MDPAGRRHLCAACRAPVLICSHCDRGQRYCTRGCAEQARQDSLHAAGRRYQATFNGRLQHAGRQRRYRQRQRQQEVTHQGSPPSAPPVPLLATASAARTEPPAGWHCHHCGRPVPEFVRQAFLRRRIRRPPRDRSVPHHGHSP